MKRIIMSTVFLFLCLISTATLANDVSLDIAIQKSTDIVLVRVKSLRSFYYGNDKSLICTSVKLEIIESIKGDKNKSDVVEIVRLGGSLDGITTSYNEYGEFVQKQECILFLKEYTSERFGSNYSIVGAYNGKYNIRDGYVIRESKKPLIISNNNIIYYSGARRNTVIDFINIIKESMK